MLAHVRKFVASEKYEGPTKSGVAMGGDVLVSVIDALTRLKGRLQVPRKSNSPRFIRPATPTSSSP
jgi:hypothetical protein